MEPTKLNAYTQFDTDVSDWKPIIPKEKEEKGLKRYIPTAVDRYSDPIAFDERRKKMLKYMSNPLLIGEITPEYMEGVARQQSVGGLVFKSLAHTAAELTGGVIEGFGALGMKVWARIFDDSIKNYEDNVLTTLGGLINNGVREALPIYQTLKAQRGGVALGDATWIASMFPTVASVASAFIPGAGVIAGVKYLSKLGKLGKITKPLSAIGKYNKVGRGLETVAGSIMSRHIDGARSSMQTFDTQYERFKGLGFNDNEAKTRAAEMAAHAQRLSWLNIGFDLLTWNSVLRTGHRIQRGLGAAATKAAGRKGLSKVVQKASEKQAKHIPYWLDLLTMTASEGAQELFIYLYQKEGIRYGEKKHGMVYDTEDFTKRFINHLGDRHTWDSAFWGAFGGFAMGGGRKAISSIMYGKAQQRSDEQIIAQMETHAKKVTQTLNDISKAKEAGDEVASETLTAMLVSELMSFSAQSGGFNWVVDLMKSYQNLNDADLKELGLTKKDVANSNQILEMLNGQLDAFKTLMDADYGLSPQENQFVGINIASLKFEIQQLEKQIKRLEESKVSEREQLEQLKEVLKDKTFKEGILADITSPSKDVRAKALNNLFEDSPDSLKYVQAMQRSRDSQIELSTAKSMGQIYAQRKKQLIEHLSELEGSDITVDKFRRNSLKQELIELNELIDNNDKLIAQRENQVKSFKEVVESSKQKLSKSELETVNNRLNLLESISNRKIDSKIATYNHAIEMRKAKLSTLTDAKKRTKLIEEVRKKGEKIQKEELASITKEIQKAKTKAEILKIEKKYPQYDLRDVVKKAISNLRKVTDTKKTKDDIKKAAIENQYKNLLPIVEQRAKEGKFDLNVSALIGDAKNKAAVGQYDAALNLLNEALSELSELDAKSKATPTTPTETTPTETTPTETTPTETTPTETTPTTPTETTPTETTKTTPTTETVDNTTGTKTTTDTSQTLTAETLSDMIANRNATISVLNSTIRLIKENLRKIYYGKANLIKQGVHRSDIDSVSNAIKTLKNEYKSIVPMLERISKILSKPMSEITIEDMEVVGQTIAYVKELEAVVTPHFTTLSNTAFANRMVTSDNQLLELRTSLSTSIMGIGLFNSMVQGFEQYDIQLTPIQKQALAKLYTSLSAFDSIVPTKDAHSIDITPDEIIQNTFTAIQDYIKSVLGNEVTNNAISFDMMSQLLFDKVKSPERYKKLMGIVKEFYNYVNVNNIKNTLIANEKIETTIDDTFYNNVLTESNYGEAYIKNPYREGSYAIFNQFGDLDSRELSELTQEQQEMFARYLALEEGDIVEIKKNDKGELEIYKDGKSLGLTLNKPGVDKDGIKYNDETNQYNSYISDMTDDTFKMLIDNYETIQTIWTKNKYQGLYKLPESHPLHQFIKNGYNKNKDTSVSLQNIPKAAIRNMLYPIFFNIHRNFHSVYNPSLETLQLNYYRMDNKMRSVFNYSQEISNAIENNLTVEYSVSSLSTGELVYINTKMANGVTYNSMELEGNLNHRVPFGKDGKLQIGVKNFTSDTHATRVVDITTGKVIEGENSAKVEKGEIYKHSMFFITEEVNGKTYMKAVTQALTGNGKHVKEGDYPIKGTAGSDYSRTLINKTMGMLQEYADGNISEKVLEDFIAMYYDSNVISKAKTRFRVKTYDDGGKSIEFAFYPHARDVNYFSVIYNPDGSLSYGISTSLNDKGYAKIHNRTKVKSTDIKSLKTYRRLIESALLDTRRGINLVKDDNGNATLPSNISEFVDVITNTTYKGVEGYVQFLIDSGALMTNLDGVRDSNGKVLSNFNPLGTPRAAIFIAAKQTILNQNAGKANKVEDTKVEDTKVEDTKVEDTKVEDTKVEDTKVEDTPKTPESPKIPESPPIELETGVTLKDITVNTFDDLFKITEAIGLDEFLNLLSDKDGNSIINYFKDLLQLSNKLYDSKLKVKFDATPIVNKEGKPIASMATYNNGIITIRPAFFYTKQGEIRTNEVMVVTTAHEIFHDTVRGVVSTMHPDTVNKLNNETDAFITSLEKQLEVDNNISDVHRNILSQYIAAYRNANAEIRWEEAFAQGILHMDVATALNSIKGENTEGLISNFFKSLINAVLKLIKVNIELDTTSRLAELAILGSPINVGIRTTKKSTFQPIVRVDNSNNVTPAESTDIDSRELYNGVISGNPTLLEKLQFAKFYKNDLVKLQRDVLGVSNNIKVWESISGKVVNNYKFVYTRTKTEAERYANMFEVSKIVETYDKHLKYKVVIPKPKDAHSMDIDGVPPIPKHISNRAKHDTFDRVEQKALNGMLTNLILTKFTLNSNNEIEGAPTFRDYITSNYKTTIRSVIIDTLKQAINDNYGNKELLERVVTDLEQPKSQVFTNFVMHFNHEVKGEILDIEGFIAENNESSFNEFITKSWDEGAQLQINPSNKLSAYVRYHLLKLSVQTANTRTGLVESKSIADVWSVLNEKHANDTSKQDVISTLKELVAIDPSYTALLNEIETDADFANAYLSLMQQSNISVSGVTHQHINGKEVIDVAPQNRNAFSEFLVWDTIKNNLVNKFDMHDLDDVFDIVYNILQSSDKSHNDIMNAFNILSEFKSNPKLSARRTLLNSSSVQRLANSISAKNIINIAKSLGISYLHLTSSQEFEALKVPLLHIALDAVRNKMSNNVNYDNKEAGRIRKIATVLARYNLKPVNFSYVSVTGEIEYSLQQSSYISQFFRGWQDTNNDNLRRRLVDVLKDAVAATRNNYSNWLWDMVDNQQVFDSTSNELLGKVYTRIPRTINLEESIMLNYIRETFGIESLNGEKFIDEKFGIKSANITNAGFDTISLVSFLLGHTKSYKYHKNTNLSSEEKAKVPGTAYYTIPNSDRVGNIMIKAPAYDVIGDLDSKTGTLKQNSITREAMANVLLQDLYEAYVAAKTIFDINPDGTFKPKEQYNPNNPDNTIAKDLHETLHGKYVNGKFVLVENGVPVGNVFKLLTMTYNSDNKLVTFLEYLQSDPIYADNPLAFLNQGDFKTIVHALDTHIHKFIDSVTNSLIESMQSRMNNVQESMLDMHRRVERGKTETQPLFKDANDFENAVKSYAINNFIFQVELGNIIGGTRAEYSKGSIHNKRIGAYSGVGNKSIGNRPIQRVIARDIFGNLDSSTQKLIKKAIGDRVALYDNFNEVDGFSFITIEEYEKRLDEHGKIHLYKDVISALKSGEPMDATLYNLHLESLKYFYYDRQLKGRENKNETVQENPAPYPYMFSSQIKHSAIVLADNTYYGSQLQDIYREMRKLGIDELDFTSAAKISRGHAINIINAEGKVDFLTDNIKLENHIQILNSSNLRLQQETTPHMIDETIKQGVQVSKLVYNNLAFNDIYNFRGDNSSKTGQQLFDITEAMKVANIRESELDLAKQWAITTGTKLEFDSNGNPLIDINKLSKEVREYLLREGIDSNAYEALRINEDTGVAAMPLISPNLRRKAFSVLSSMITKRVINQKMAGIHAPIIPNAFVNKSDIISDENMDAEMARYMGINYLDEVHKRGDYKLKYKRVESDGKIIHEVEMVINPFLSKFINEEGNIDINEIHKLNPEILRMIGMRIPTQGKNVMFVGKVVGFMNNGSTVAMLPSPMVAQTGWDFDIDSVYLYYKNAKITRNRGVLTSIKIIPYHENESKARYAAWKEAKGKKVYNQVKNAIIDSLSDSELDVLTKVEKQLGKARVDYALGQQEVTKLFNELKVQETNIINAVLGSLPETISNLLVDGEGKSKYYNSLHDLKNDIDANLVKAYRDKLVEYSRFEAQGLLDDTMLEDFYRIQKEVEEVSMYSEYLSTQIENISNAISQEINLSEVRDNKKEIARLRTKMKPLLDRINKTRDELLKEEYDALSDEMKNTREARDNRILDVWDTILTSDRHFDESVNPDTIQESLIASQYINRLWGQNMDDFNLFDYGHMANIRDVNRSIAVLKGNAVGTMALMSVLSAVNAQFAEGVKVKVSKSQVNNMTIPQLEILLGKDKIIDLGNNVYEVMLEGIANNITRDGKDIFGNKIDSQNNQTISHILDAVGSQSSFNLNEYTLGVYMILGYSPISTMFQLNNETNPNKFILPNLFIHQPIVVDYAKSMATNKTDIYNSPVKTLNRIEDKYIYQLLESEGLTDILSDMIKNSDMVGTTKEAFISARTREFAKAVKSRRLTKVDRTNINAIVDYIGNTFKGDDITDMVNAIQEYKSDKGLSANGIIYQLYHLNRFRNLLDKANSIVGLNSALSMDKKKTGPNVSDTNYNIRKIDRYNDEMKNNMVVGDNVGTILVDGQPILEKILPRHFRLDAKSVYPSFEQYLESGSKFAKRVFAQVSPVFNSKMDELRELIVSKINNPTAVIEVDEMITHYAIMYGLNNNLATKLLIDDWDIGALNGDNTEMLNTRMRQRLNGTFRDGNNYSYKMATRPLSYVAPDGSKTLYSDEHYERFKKLSLTNKIHLLRNSEWHNEIITHSDYANGAHILQQMHLHTDKSYWDKYTSTGMSLVRSEVDSNLVISSWYGMLNAKEIYGETVGRFFEDVAIDLIRYSYFNHGFNFGNNISRYIDNRIISTPNAYDGIGNYGTELYNLNNVLGEDTLDIADLYKEFLKSHVDTAVPALSERILRNAPYYTEPKVITQDGIDHIYLALDATIAESIIDTTIPYVAYTKAGEKTLMKIYNVTSPISNKPVVLLFPIVKHSPNEIGYTTNVNNSKSNIAQIDGDEIVSLNSPHSLMSENIADEVVKSFIANTTYINHLEEVVSSDRKSQIRDTDAHSTEITLHSATNQQDAIRQMASKYDNIIYLGDTNTMEYRVLSAATPMIHKSFTTARNVANFIKNYNTGNNIAVIGNIDMTFSNKVELMQLTEYLENQNPNLKSIGTISNSNVSSIIKRHTNKHVDNYNSNKNVPNHIVHSMDIEGNIKTEEELAIIRQARMLTTATGNLVKLNRMYANKKVDFKNTTDTLKNEIFAQNLFEHLSINNLEKMVEALGIQETLLLKLYSHSQKLVDDIRQVKWEDLSSYDTSLHNNELQRHVDKLNEAISIYEIINTFNDIQTLSHSQLEYSKEDIESIKNYNKMVTDIRTQLDAFNKLGTIIKNQLDLYLGGMIAKNSTNPTFINKFNKEYGEVITLDEVRENVTKLLTSNEDLTTYQYWLNSIFDTGNTAVDSIMMEYAKITGQLQRDSEIMIDDLVDKLGAFLGKDYILNPDEVAKGKPAKYDRKKITSSAANADRVGERISKLFNKKDGTLISEFNYRQFYNDYYAKVKLVSDAKGKTRAEYKAALKELEQWKSENMLPSDNDATLLSDSELKAIAEVSETLDDRTYRRYLRKRRIEVDHSKKSYKNYYKLIPSDKYRDARYTNLTQEEKVFIEYLRSIPQDLLARIYHMYDVSPDFFPIYNQALTKNVILEQILGYAKIQQTKLEKGLNNESYRVYEPPMTRYTEYNHSYTIPNRKWTESDEAYEARVVEEVNKEWKALSAKRKADRKTPFKTYQEIVDYNDKVAEDNKNETVSRMIFDPYVVMKGFIEATMEHRKILQFAGHLNLMQDGIKRMTFYTKHRNKTIPIKGSESRMYRRVEGFKSALHNDSKVSNTMDRMLNSLKQGTSMTYMAFNITGNIKNATHGLGNMVMESAAGEFVDRNTLFKAYRKYPTMGLLQDFHSEYSDNIDVALIKRMRDLLELKNEKGYERTAEEVVAHRILMTNNIMYYGNNAVEHWMQYSMALGMMMHHRIIDGKVVNFTQFARESRIEALKKILPKSKIAKLNEFVAKGLEYNKEFSRDPNRFIKVWLEGETNGVPNLNKKERQAYIETIKEVEKSLQEKYNTGQTVYDQFEVRDGRAVIKQGSQLSEEMFDAFQQKIKKVNHSIHGIYNRIDRHLLKNTLWGDLAFQFRSWIAPNWNRYFGVKWGKSVYNEALGSYRIGAYTSLGEFLSSPIGRNIRAAKRGDIGIKQALINMLDGYIRLVTNLSFHWRTMDVQQRQNVKRALMNFANIVVFGALLNLVGRISRDDDDERTYLEHLALYELHATLTETATFVPIVGWMGTINRTKQHTMAAERVTQEWLNIMKLITTYPFLDEEGRIYQQGVYKDKNRMAIALMKNTPIVRQYHKFKYIPQYTKWYQLYNPFSDIGALFKK